MYKDYATKSLSKSKRKSNLYIYIFSLIFFIFSFLCVQRASYSSVHTFYNVSLIIYNSVPSLNTIKSTLFMTTPAPSVFIGGNKNIENTKDYKLGYFIESSCASSKKELSSMQKKISLDTVAKAFEQSYSSIDNKPCYTIKLGPYSSFSQTQHDHLYLESKSIFNRVYLER